MFIHPKVVENWRLRELKEELLNSPFLSLYEIAGILTADYRMQVKLILHKHIKNDRIKTIS